MTVTHSTTATGSPLIDAADWNAGHTVTGLATSTHTHAGADIDSGTVADARIASTIARDSEIVATKLDDFATPDDNTDLNASTSRHGLLLKLNNNSANFLDGTGAWGTPAGSGTPARTEAVLSADVTMTTANTEYDGPTSTPAAGVYDVTAYAMIGTGTANVITAIVGRLKYGSTVVDERQGYEYVGNDFGYPVTIPLSARVTADGSTAIKISATTDRASAVLMRDPFNNSSGVHRGCLLVLIKVG